MRHHEARAELLDAAVAVLDRLREVVARVHVHQREREAARPERLLGQAQEHDRVLAAGEQQDGTLELGGDLTHDVDRLGLEGVEMCQLVGHRAERIPGKAYRVKTLCSFPRSAVRGPQPHCS